jgi:hypothetical protein
MLFFRTAITAFRAVFGEHPDKGIGPRPSPSPYLCYVISLLDAMLAVGSSLMKLTASICYGWVDPDKDHGFARASIV